jgi:ABC-type multidrug transport system fused ATPase/permease subunit
MKNSPLLRCLAIYREIPIRFLVTAGLFTIVNFGQVWQQWLIGRAINEVGRGVVVVRSADGALDYHRALFWLLLLTGVALIRGVLQFAAGLNSLIIGQALLTRLRVRVLTQIQRLDLAYHWLHGAGELITRTTRDSDKVRDALMNFWRQVFETSIVIIASVGMLCWYAPWLGIMPLVLMLAGLTILVLQTDRLVILDRAAGLAYDRVNQDLSEGIGGVRVIKAFGLEDARVADFQTQVTAFTVEARAALYYAALRVPVPQIVIALGHVWVIAYGAHLIGAGRLNIGELVASLLVANTLVLRIEGIGRVMQVFADARSSAGRIWEVLDAEPGTNSGAGIVPPGPLGIQLHQVRVAAPGGGNDILRDVSLRIEPGELVALVGNTGAGKSTLMGLLPRLVDADGGVVSIGSSRSGWVEVKGLEFGSLRERVHVVPQESFLFSDTLAANLRMGAPEADEGELRAALRLASGEEILDNLPDGLAARLGDRGVTLSGGQRQRLCLARALLAKASILGLDDATSALDAATERTVLENIRRLRSQPDRAVTVLIVSSKLSTILFADRVLLLDGGRIAAQGTHAELVANSAQYRDLMGL